MKSIWTGSIGFGLVNIPVKMHSASRDSSLDLDMLDRRDYSNIHYMRVNAKTGKEVKWEDIVKGYELNGKYVVLKQEDFEKASPKKSGEIEIDQFVAESQINTMYYEMPYYLEPLKAGIRAYVLLREALESSGKVGLGTFVMRNREHLVVIKTHGKILIANRIRFKEEIKVPELKIPNSRPKPGELKMAIALINGLSDDFNINKFKDSYTAALMKMIRAKARGKTLVSKPLRVAHVNTKDLMAQLKASLDHSGKRKKAS